MGMANASWAIRTKKRFFMDRNPRFDGRVSMGVNTFQTWLRNMSTGQFLKYVSTRYRESGLRLTYLELHTIAPLVCTRLWLFSPEFYPGGVFKIGIRLRLFMFVYKFIFRFIGIIEINFPHGLVTLVKQDWASFRHFRKHDKHWSWRGGGRKEFDTVAIA